MPKEIEIAASWRCNTGLSSTALSSGSYQQDTGQTDSSGAPLLLQVL